MSPAVVSSDTIHQWSHRLLRWLIGLLFIWSGAIKFADPPAFVDILARYGLVPEPFLVPLSVVLPAVEMLAGAGMLANRRQAILGVMGMLAVFTAVLWYAILTKLDVVCGGFSLAEPETPTTLWWRFWRNWLLLAATAYLLFMPARPEPGDPPA